jgi:lipid A 3-O-deacylase
MVVIFAARGLEAADGDEAKKPKTLEERNLWRLEWDNDAFVRVDNGFTEGWSLERHSHQYDTWDEMKPSKFSGWISRTIPGLDDDGGRVVKRGTGLSQITMTPEDISNPDPQPGDIPWAGSLGWAESWYAFDNRSLNAFQIYFGILGPYSLAGSFQVQIHHLIGADEPLGWDNQLRTEPLLNLNYNYRRKLVSAGEYATKGLAGDFSIGLEGALGNLVTSAGATFEGRFGWGLPKGFTQLSDPPGYGIMLDAEKGVPALAHVYFSVVFRVGATGHSVFFDGNTFRDSPHPGLEYDAISHATIFGFHVDHGRFGFHFNFYKYNQLPFHSVNPLTDLTWGNITLEYRY